MSFGFSIGDLAAVTGLVQVVQFKIKELQSRDKSKNVVYDDLLVRLTSLSQALGQLLNFEKDYGINDHRQFSKRASKIVSAISENLTFLLRLTDGALQRHDSGHWSSSIAVSSWKQDGVLRSHLDGVLSKLAVLETALVGWIQRSISSAVLEDVESLEKTTIDQCKPIEMGLLARVEEITGSLSSDYVCQSSSVHFDFEASSVKVFDQGDLKEENLFEWPDSSLPNDANNATVFRSNILTIPTKRRHGSELRRLWVTADILTRIVKRAQLSENFLSSLFDTTALTEKCLSPSNSGHLEYLFRSPISASSTQDDWVLLITLDKDSLRANSIIVGLNSDERDNMLRLLPDLGLTHPLAIFITLMKMMTQKDSAEVKRHGAALFKIEVQTRMHIYDQVPNEVNQDIIDARSDQERLDEITTKLNGILSRLSFHKMRLESSRASLDRLYEWESDFPLGTGNNKNTGLSVVIEKQQRYISSVLHELEFNLRIAQSQLKVVYNMLIQHDNRVQFDLAETSHVVAQAAKDDSTSMKTLALLGTLFLPGTFISALFSTTMFDWKARKGETVVSDRFWIYWAFTVPITLLIFGICIFWLHEEKTRDQRHIRAKYKTMGRRAGNMQHGEPESGPTSGFRLSAQRLKQRFRSEKEAEADV